MLAQLHIRTVNAEDHIIEVIGDVSGVDAPRLAEALVQFDAGDVIIDLSAVTTIDGAGVRALAAAQRHIERRRGELILHGASRIVRDALEAPTSRATPLDRRRSEAKPPDFFVDAAHVADTSVLRFVGELDLRFASAAKQASIAALPEIKPDSVRLTLDLSSLTFCDASGISVIVQLAHAAAARGYRTVLQQPTANVRKVLSITQVDTWLEVEDTAHRPTRRSSDGEEEM